MKPKAKRKGIVVTVERGRFYSHRCHLWEGRRESITVEYLLFLRAGMQPLNPGESMKIRVVIEEP